MAEAGGAAAIQVEVRRRTLKNSPGRMGDSKQFESCRKKTEGRFSQMRFFPVRMLLAGAIAFSAAPGMSISYAPATAISPGTQVVDVAGNPVGTVQSVRGAELIVRTDRHEVRLPVRSFTPDKGKLVFGMTREALNRATDAMLAKNFLPGSPVRGKNGALVGHIEAVNEQYVTVELQSGQSIRLPRDSIAPASGGAVLGITVAELNQMVSKTANPAP